MAQLADTTLFSDGNLKEYYKLESVSANKNGNNLTNTGTVAFNAARWALGADYSTSWGSNGKVLRSGTSFSTDMSGAFSVSFWIKERITIVGTSATAHMIDWRSTSGTSRYCIVKYQDNAGTPRISIDAAGTTINFNVTLGTASFRHIVLTCSSGGTITLYIDGSSSTTGSRGSTTDANNNFAIGNAVDSTSNGVAAIIDDVGVFNRLLTSGEVTTLFSAGALTYSNSETISLTEAVTTTIGRTVSISETLSLTETYSIVAPRTPWSNSLKPTTTWTNPSKP